MGVNGSVDLLTHLVNIQHEKGFIEESDIKQLSEILDLSEAHIFSVASFYSFINIKKKVKYNIKLCKTLMCDMKRSSVISVELENILGISFGDVSPDNRYNLDYCGCLGFCDKGPAMIINGRIYTELTKDSVKKIIEELE